MYQVQSLAICLGYLIFSLQHPLEAGMVIIPILWVRKLRLQEEKQQQLQPLTVGTEPQQPDPQPIPLAILSPGSWGAGEGGTLAHVPSI